MARTFGKGKLDAGASNAGQGGNPLTWSMLLLGRKRKSKPIENG